MEAKVWSPQQAAFLDWAQNSSGSCVLEAVAGAGKTTTVLEAAKRMDGQVAIMAYNKKIAEEIKEKLKADGVAWTKVQGGTVHSFGFQAYRKFQKFVKVDGFKVANIVQRLIPPATQLHPYSDAVVKIVSLAKQHILGIEGSIEDKSIWFEIADHYDVFESDNGEAPVEELIEIAITALKQSNQILDLIDYDDMIYMPLLKKLPFWKYDVVIVDEAQDTNAARRALVGAMVKKGGRVIAVGDRHQAIYGFTGADANSLDRIKLDFDAIDLPLTVTYRCPRQVVGFAQQWVNHITAHESAPEGSVTSTTVTEMMKRNDLNGDAAILCRVTKPLVSLAFSLIRNRIPCRIEGRDIGKQIKKLMLRWKVSDLEALEDKLQDYLNKETTKLLAKKQETKLAAIEDSVQTILVIIEQCQAEGKHTVHDATQYVDDMFADDVSKILVLSTIHKSKGREWERVFWLDRAKTCPSKWARQAWQMDQERNLMYVAATRAKSELIDLASTPTTQG